MISSGHSLTPFVRHCADHFLSSEHKDIRMEAVRTCSRLLSPSLTVSSLNTIQHNHLQISTLNINNWKVNNFMFSITGEEDENRFKLLLPMVSAEWLPEKKKKKKKKLDVDKTYMFVTCFPFLKSTCLYWSCVLITVVVRTTKSDERDCHEHSRWCPQQTTGRRHHWLR